MNKITLLFYIVSLFILCVISKTDMKKRCITNKNLLSLFLVKCVYLVIIYCAAKNQIKEYILDSLAGFLAFYLIFYVIWRIKSQDIGKGDVYLCTVGGFVFGFSLQVRIVILSLLLLFFYGVILIFQKKKKRNDCFPYAPFYTIAFLGEIIIWVGNVVGFIGKTGG